MNARFLACDTDDDTSEVIAIDGDDDALELATLLVAFKGVGPLQAGEAARDVADRLNAVLDAAKQQYRPLISA